MSNETTVGQLYGERVEAFLKSSKLFGDDYLDYVDPVKSYLQQNISKIREDMSQLCADFIEPEDFRFYKVYEICKECEDEEQHFFFTTILEKVCDRFIPVIGIIVGDEKMLDDPIVWFNETYDFDEKISLFKYLDLFHWLNEKYLK